MFLGVTVDGILLGVNTCKQCTILGIIYYIESIEHFLSKSRHTLPITVKPRFTAEFGGKETPAVNRGPR